MPSIYQQILQPLLKNAPKNMPVTNFRGMGTSALRWVGGGAAYGYLSSREGEGISGTLKGAAFWGAMGFGKQMGKGMFKSNAVGFGGKLSDAFASSWAGIRVGTSMDAARIARRLSYGAEAIGGFLKGQQAFNGVQGLSESSHKWLRSRSDVHYRAAMDRIHKAKGRIY